MTSFELCRQRRGNGSACLRCRHAYKWVAAERLVSNGCGADRCRSEPVQIIIVTGHALAAPTRFATLVEPAPQPVEDDDLAPEGAFGIDRPYSWNAQSL